MGNYICVRKVTVIFQARVIRSKGNSGDERWKIPKVKRSVGGRLKKTSELIRWGWWERQLSCLPGFWLGQQTGRCSDERSREERGNHSCLQYYRRYSYEEITTEKHENFINMEGGMVEVEPKDITDLWGWRGINFKKKATQRGWSKQEKENNAIITKGEEQLLTWAVHSQMLPRQQEPSAKSACTMFAN